MNQEAIDRLLDPAYIPDTHLSNSVHSYGTSQIERIPRPLSWISYCTNGVHGRVSPEIVDLTEMCIPKMTFEEQFDPASSSSLIESCRKIGVQREQSLYKMVETAATKNGNVFVGMPFEHWRHTLSFIQNRVQSRDHTLVKASVILSRQAAHSLMSQHGNDDWLGAHSDPCRDGEIAQHVFNSMTMRIYVSPNVPEDRAFAYASSPPQLGGVFTPIWQSPTANTIPNGASSISAIAGCAIGDHRCAVVLDLSVPGDPCERCNGTGIGLAFDDRNMARDVPGGCKVCQGSGRMGTA